MLKRALIFLSAWVYVCKWLLRLLFASRIFSFLIVWKLMMFFFFVLTCVLLFRKQNQKKNTDKTSGAWNNENVCLCKCFSNESGRYWYPLTCTTSPSPPQNKGVSFTKLYSTSAILWRVQILLLAEN